MAIFMETVKPSEVHPLQATVKAIWKYFKLAI